MVRIKEVLEKVLKKVKPSAKELREDMEVAGNVIRQIEELEGSHIEVGLVGSLARNTHLKGDRDLDIFVMFPEKLSRAEFEKEGLRIGKRVFRGHKWEKAFTEHPYIRGEIKGFKIEIVPSYKIKSTADLKSAVDRSPFHNQYLQKKLKPGQKDEVRLLRQFLKGIGCYGADTKVSSVPGYVTELLILKYGNFKKCLKAVADWEKGEVIDIEKHWKSEKEVRNKFNHHFIVVDPTDKNRNVAAALSFQQYTRFIDAARVFLEKPSINFFFGRKAKAWKLTKVREMLRKKEIIAVRMPYPKKALSDIVYGQIRKFRNKAMNQLEYYGFQVFHGREWTDEESEIIIVLELENVKIQRITQHFGPEVTRRAHSEKFLRENRKIEAGPRIVNGRWVVEKERKYFDANVLLSDLIAKGKKVEKKPLKTALRKAVVLNEKKIIDFYRKNKEFAVFLTKYLKGKEDFLEY